MAKQSAIVHWILHQMVTLGRENVSAPWTQENPTAHPATDSIFFLSRSVRIVSACTCSYFTIAESLNRFVLFHIGCQSISHTLRNVFTLDLTSVGNIFVNPPFLMYRSHIFSYFSSSHSYVDIFIISNRYLKLLRHPETNPTLNCLQRLHSGGFPARTKLTFI